MTADFFIASTPIDMGDFTTAATVNRSSEAIRTRAARRTNGSAYGKAYLAPTKPVLHRSTKTTGANRDSFKKIYLVRSRGEWLLIFSNHSNNTDDQ